MLPTSFWSRRKECDHLWTARKLEDLFRAAGIGRSIPDGEMFAESEPTPTPGRPGAPEHPTTPCVEWSGRRVDGYGVVGYRGSGVRVHRLACELAHWPIPSGLVCAHQCENRACANPDHIVVMSSGDNSRQGAMRVWSDEILSAAPWSNCPNCGTPSKKACVADAGRGVKRWAYSCKGCISDWESKRKVGEKAGYYGKWRRPITDNRTISLICEVTGEDSGDWMVDADAVDPEVAIADWRAGRISANRLAEALSVSRSSAYVAGGKRDGRPPKEYVRSLIERFAAGEIKVQEVMELTGIPRSTAYAMRKRMEHKG